METTTERPMFQRAYETQQLIERLMEAVKSNDYSVITYDALASLIGRNKADMKVFLRSARRRIEKEHHRLFDPQRGIGVKLLTPAEQSGVAENAIERVKSTSRRQVSRLSCVQFDKLDDAGKTTHNMASSVIGAVQLFTRKKSMNLIAAAAEKSSKRLAITDTLKLFE